MKFWQIVVGVMLAVSFAIVLAVALALVGAATSYGMSEVHESEICVVDGPSFGFQLGPQNVFLCDVRLPAGFRAKVVYEGEQTYYLNNPGISIMGMTGAIKPGDRITYSG